MKIARRADHKRMAWKKNGKGLTEEVAAFPPGSDVGSFDWRLSIAHVAVDGPFSVFAGIDRTIALLDGPGLTLDLPDGHTVEFKPGSEPFSFCGEWEISSRNLGGPTIDLNIMTRRGRCTHEMRRLMLAPGAAFSAPGFGWTLFNAPARIEAGGQEQSVDRFDALSFDAGAKIVNRGDEFAALLVVTIETSLRVADERA